MSNGYLELDMAARLGNVPSAIAIARQRAAAALVSQQQQQQQVADISRASQQPQLVTTTLTTTLDDNLATPAAMAAAARAPSVDSMGRNWAVEGQLSDDSLGLSPEAKKVQARSRAGARSLSGSRIRKTVASQAR